MTKGGRGSVGGVLGFAGAGVDFEGLGGGLGGGGGFGGADILTGTLADNLFGVALLANEAVEDADEFFFGDSAEVVEGLEGAGNVGTRHGEGDVIPTGEVAGVDLELL